jgi:hypothetical protein
MLAPLIIAISLCGQHLRESKHDPYSTNLFVDRRSPALIAKVEAQKRARHVAAEKSRRDFDQALAIMRSTPTRDCPCHALRGRGFE